MLSLSTIILKHLDYNFKFLFPAMSIRKDKRNISCDAVYVEALAELRNVNGKL
jgi:hypothetical protein